jgi:DNA mismatch endonuclease (patch repair protein)
MVNGCFWHGHKNCSNFRLPKSRVLFWKDKIEKNVTRDEAVKRKLRKLGWRVLIVWECQLNPEKSDKTLAKLLLSVNKK